MAKLTAIYSNSSFQTTTIPNVRIGNNKAKQSQFRNEFSEYSPFPTGKYSGGYKSRLKKK